MEARELKVGDEIFDGGVPVTVLEISRHCVAVQYPDDEHPEALKRLSVERYLNYENGLPIKVPAVSAQPTPAVDSAKLARAIFDSDPRVQAFVQGKGDYKRPASSLDAQVLVVTDGKVEEFNAAQYTRILDKAWELNEQDWTAQAYLRAHRILHLLRK